MEADTFDKMEKMWKKFYKRFGLFGPIWVKPLWQPMWPTFRGMEEFPIETEETDDDIIIKAILPGFSKEEISVKATENNLEIFAQHKEKKIEQTKKMYRAERRFGSFRRFLTLPAKIDYTKTDAKFENGVLTITLPKKEKKKVGKEIEIK